MSEELGMTIKQEEDFSKWYLEVVRKGNFVDQRSPIKGFDVILPWSYAIWEIIQNQVDSNLKKNGVKNAYFPMLFPESLFEKEKEAKVKKIARYQQFRATNKIIDRVVNKEKKQGLIWHTQGSGKSITMVMLSKYILSELDAEDPKVIVVTDRKNLDKQIHKTFNHTRIKASRATSGNHLIKLIGDNNAAVITTLVHKFDTASKKTKATSSRDIFMLVDESHRTQYGELNIKMKNVFPNACYLGFTGTPSLLVNGLSVDRSSLLEVVEDALTKN